MMAMWIGCASAGESNTPLPDAVRAAIVARFPNATIVSTARETEDGETRFEAVITEGDRRREVEAQPDGTIVAVEERVSVESVPGPAKAAVLQLRPGGTVTRAEHIETPTGVVWELRVESKGSRAHDITVDAVGKVVEDEGGE